LDELRDALELATEDELQQLTHILFCRRFNPLDYLQTPDPMEVQSQDWNSWLDSIESRFRYLAADGFTVLKGKSEQFSYREALIKVCHYLKVPYSNRMSTVDIESEIFLYLLNKAWNRLPNREQQALTGEMETAINNSDLPEDLSNQLPKAPLNVLLKGSSALAVSSVVKPWLLKQIAQQFAVHFATYEVAKTTIIRGGAAAATQFESYVALQTAQRGMAVSAARYGAVRTVFAVVGPLLWGYFLADLGWKAIATNYARIIPVIFALAQIRLIRGESWQVA